MTTEKLRTLRTIMMARERDLTDAQSAYQRAKKEFHEEEARLLPGKPPKTHDKNEPAPTKRSKCRMACPWSKTATVFMDYWWKLCSRKAGHDGKHKNRDGAQWDQSVFMEPPGFIASLGYGSLNSSIESGK
jgi:hypothetical protein